MDIAYQQRLAHVHPYVWQLTGRLSFDELCTLKGRLMVEGRALDINSQAYQMSDRLLGMVQQRIETILERSRERGTLKPLEEVKVNSIAQQRKAQAVSLALVNLAHAVKACKSVAELKECQRSIVLWKQRLDRGELPVASGRDYGIPARIEILRHIIRHDIHAMSVIEGKARRYNQSQVARAR